MPMSMLHAGRYVDETHPIAALLDARAEASPDARMLVDQHGRCLTFGEVAELARKGVRWLKSVGVSTSNVVAWQLPTGLEAVVVMLSLARLDVVQAPIIHIFRSREVAAATTISGADVLIVDGSTEQNTPAGTDTRVIRLPENLIETLGQHESGRDVEEHRPVAEDRWIYFTSGSTGTPKGVAHNDRSLLTAASGFVAHTGMGSVENDVGSVVFPIGHVGGIIYSCASLLAGLPVVITPPAPIDRLVETFRMHNVTIGGGSTAVYQMLIDAATADEPLRVPSLRVLVGGGAACPPSVHHQARAHLGVPIVHAYGMTESPMICVQRPTNGPEQRENTVGEPIPGVEVRATRYGPDCPDGEALGEECEGEIEIRGATLTSGYLDRAAWHTALTPDGWFRTGDRGVIRADGCVVITGRTKDLIIRKGENIAPQEIEDFLSMHPLVEQVAVVGLPDEHRGELVCAVVRRSPRHREATLTELCAFLDEQGLMKQKWPEKLVYVDDYPLTGLGKVSKPELVKQIS